MTRFQAYRPATFRITCGALALCLGLMVSPCRGQLQLGGNEWRESGGSVYQMGFTPTLVTSTGWGVSSGGWVTNNQFETLGQRWHFGGPSQNLYGTQSNGVYQQLYFFDINNLAGVVGYHTHYNSSGNFFGYRAGFWGANSDVVELGSMNSSSNGFSDFAYAINDSGTIVGSSDDGLGSRYAVTWTTQNTTPSILGSLGSDPTGASSAEAFDINQAGAIAGSAVKYSSTGASLGQKAVRWDAGQTVATELDSVSLGNGSVSHFGFLINNVNQVAGSAVTHDGSGNTQVVRWAANGAAQLMDNLSVSLTGEFRSSVTAMNDRGTLVGTAAKFDTNGNYLGDRAVRWNAITSAIEELQHGSFYGQDPTGRADSMASGINRAGLAVGYITKYTSNGDWNGSVGALWLPNGAYFEANWLNPIPVEGGNGTWDIQRIDRIAANGWIGGYGLYTENNITVGRAFVAQVGFGGVWVNPGLGLRSWGDGDNWDSGTPALQHGSARFASPGSFFDVSVDQDTTTNFIDVSEGQLRLRLNRNRLFSREGIWVGSQAQLSLSTDVDSTTHEGGLFVGDITNQGQLSAGQSPGFLAVDGNLFNEGTLLFEIGGTGFGEYDQIWLSGLFSAGGLLQVVLTEDFLPTSGDIFQLMQFGEFDYQGMQFDFSGAPLPVGYRWFTGNFARSGRIQVRAIPEPLGLPCLALGIALIGSAVRRRRDQ